MHSVTDRRTDGRTDGQQAYANSRSYCVAVRSAKNLQRAYQYKATIAHIHQYVFPNFVQQNLNDIATRFIFWALNAPTMRLRSGHWQHCAVPNPAGGVYHPPPDTITSMSMSKTFYRRRRALRSSNHRREQKC